MLHLTSEAFDQHQRIPEPYTGEGKDVSPQLAWTGAPEGTESFALIVDDPDAPRAEPWVHWLAFNIPGDAAGLAEDDAAGGTEGVNSFGNVGYGGPMPPPGHGPHHYHFKVYALDTRLDLEGEVTKRALLQAMEGHILAEGVLVGVYER